MWIGHRGGRGRDSPVKIKEEKKGKTTIKLGQIIGYDKGVSHCRELLHANQVQDVGEDYGMNFKPFPDMRFRTDKVFDLKKFQSRPGLISM